MLEASIKQNVIHNTSDFQLEGYRFSYNESKINTCKSSIFYVRTDLLSNPETIQINASKFLIVYIEKFDNTLTIFEMYRCHVINVSDFIDDLEKLLCQIKLGSSIASFCGDININMLSKNYKIVQKCLVALVNRALKE